MVASGTLITVMDTIQRWFIDYNQYINGEIGLVGDWYEILPRLLKTVKEGT